MLPIWAKQRVCLVTTQHTIAYLWEEAVKRDTVQLPPLVALAVTFKALNHAAATLQSSARYISGAVQKYLLAQFKPLGSSKLRTHCLSPLTYQIGGSKSRMQWKVWTSVSLGRCQTPSNSPVAKLDICAHNPGCTWLAASIYNKVFELVDIERGGKKSVWVINRLNKRELLYNSIANYGE